MVVIENTKIRHMSYWLVLTLLSACGGESGKSTHSSSSSIVSSSSSSSTSFSSSSSNANSSSSLVNIEKIRTGFDTEMQKLLQETGVTAISIAVAKDGLIQYEQAYGFYDAAKTVPLTPNALMRTASIVKPITAAVIRKLARDGKLALTDHAFCTGTNAPCWLDMSLLSSTSDVRLKDISIDNLLNHQGGWYRDVSGDPFTWEVEIRDAFSLSNAPSRTDDIRYVIAKNLDFTPGQPDGKHDNYSNFGYMLLTQIIEQASRDTYVHYVQTEILAQLGIASSEFKAATSKLADHDPREPAYISTDLCPSVFTKGKEALCSEEGANAENWTGVGMAITTAKTMALFAQAYMLPDFNDALTQYQVSGELLTLGKTHNGIHDGLLPGTATIVRQLPSGRSYAIFLNKFPDNEEFLSGIQRLDNLLDQ